MCGILSSAVFCPVWYFVQYGILTSTVFCPVWYCNHWYFDTGIMTCGILYCGILTVVFCPRYFVRRYSDPLVFWPWYFVTESSLNCHALLRKHIPFWCTWFGLLPSLNNYLHWANYHHFDNGMFYWSCLCRNWMSAIILVELYNLFFLMYCKM